MSKYISAKEIKEQFGVMYREGLREIFTELSKLGYRAIRYAYEKGNTKSPKKYMMVPRIEDNDLVYYRRGRRKGQLRKRRAPIPDGMWRNRTYNLHDSFGSAVYYAGKLVENSDKYLEKHFSNTNNPVLNMKGRERLKLFFESAHYGKSSGEIVLVCVAAMYYARRLERGEHRGHYKIQVISAARDYVNRHIKEIPGVNKRAVVLKGTSLLSDESLQRRFERDIRSKKKKRR